jgi:hypothetical protein
LNIGLGAMCVLVLSTVYLFVFDMYGNVLGSLVGLVMYVNHIGTHWLLMSHRISKIWGWTFDNVGIESLYWRSN